MHLFLLQSTSLDYMGSGFKTDSKTIYFFIFGVAALVIILILVNVLKKKLPANAIDGIKTPGSNGFHPFSTMNIHRQLSGMGLNHDQIKMLDYIFKQDNVTNPQHSLASPALLDRHFKKAYKMIERSAHSEEEAQQRFNLLFSTRNTLEANSGNDTTTTTRKIPENTDAVLGFNKDSYPVKILSNKGESLIVENPRTALGSIVQIPRGSKVTLSFFSKSSKGYSFESRIIGSGESGGKPVLHLIHSNQVKNLSKRRFRRRQVAVSAFFYFVNLDNSSRGKEKRMVVDKRRLTGSIMDISIGGCSIKTNVIVPSGTRLKIETSYGGTNIAALGQVIRTNRTGVKSTLHVVFLKVPMRSLNAINAMVFEYIDD